MIATQTQPFRRFEWHQVEGRPIYVFEAFSDDGPVASLRLAFDSLTEAESFATMAGQMAMDFRLTTEAESCARCQGLPTGTVCNYCFDLLRDEKNAEECAAMTEDAGAVTIPLAPSLDSTVWPF